MEGTRVPVLYLSVWIAAGHPGALASRSLETVKAEVLYRCRETIGQWPASEHKIQFYPSNEALRAVASRIYRHAIAVSREPGGPA